MKGTISFIVGLIFAIGLGISGMTRPHIVRGFLDVFGKWDWSLMGVMAGAIVVHMIAFHLITRKDKPILEATFQIPKNRKIDFRLILGAAIFGMGWGWTGICPGPGIVSLASGNVVFIYFIVSMLIGMKTFQLFEKKYLN